ncbi:MAG: right-handed parallel beta-helix repeat-containing protein, partial [Gemmatales bacterium]|nr:right-handed parallel beta-helix repeat-containing protein [Gemmatales bacterium]MDW8176599.1 right-handed parallel beta-helix repeat-containing protein [Gemmatales bacterium]
HPTCDLYALAVMYAYLATGRHPFGVGASNVTPIGVIDRQRRGEWDLRGLSENDAAWVKSALHPDPQARFDKGARAWVRGVYQAQSQQKQRSASIEPKAEKTEIVLTPNQSLAEAVQSAPENVVIVLQPGTYRLTKPLEIHKPLTIKGTGPEKTIITSDAEGFVLAYQGKGRFWLAQVSVIHSRNRPADAFQAGSGIVEIVQCLFRGGVRSDEKRIGGYGLRLHGEARAIVRNCRCQGNALHGIGVWDRAQVLLEANTCTNNGQCGIVFFNHAIGKVRNNTCRGNGYHGIGVYDQAQAELQGNTCENNRYDGILFLGSAGGKARNNTCRDNGFHGIQVSDQAQPVLESNRCEANQRCGILYSDSAAGIAHGNICRANRQQGIGVVGRAQPSLEGNICEGNQSYGIAYFENAGGTARDNACRGNGQPGIGLFSRGQPFLEDNSGEMEHSADTLFNEGTRSPASSSFSGIRWQGAGQSGWRQAVPYGAAYQAQPLVGNMHPGPPGNYAPTVPISQASAPTGQAQGPQTPAGHQPGGNVASGHGGGQPDDDYGRTLGKVNKLLRKINELLERKNNRDEQQLESTHSLGEAQTGGADYNYGEAHDVPAAYPAVAYGMTEEGYADQSDAYEPEPEGDYEAESDYEYGGDELEAEPMEEDFGGDFGGVAE